MTAGSSVAVIDYGMGNLHSVAKALELVGDGVHVQVTSDPAVILTADRVILPGVGAIRDCVGEIKRLGFDAVVAKVIASGTPLLGICVGLQALMDHSEENNGVDCLGLLAGKVKFFGNSLVDSAGDKLKVPHMGWNEVTHSAHPLWAGIEQGCRFYFVHSYYVEAANDQQIAGTCNYPTAFSVALAQDNVFAVQFHPEKSSTAGLTLLRNFLTWDGRSSS
ncbi:MAG: glutamine amidotransferase [Chitinophagales bacterium]|jgi:glutamine amidotransferase